MRHSGFHSPTSRTKALEAMSIAFSICGIRPLVYVASCRMYSVCSKIFDWTGGVFAYLTSVGLYNDDKVCDSKDLPRMYVYM